jgi:hypothetical protein
MSQPDGHARVGDEVEALRELVRLVREDLLQARLWANKPGVDVYGRLACCEEFVAAALDRLGAVSP